MQHRMKRRTAATSRNGGIAWLSSWIASGGSLCWRISFACSPSEMVATVRCASRLPGQTIMRACQHHFAMRPRSGRNRPPTYSHSLPFSSFVVSHRIMPDYNQHVRLLSPEPWLVGTTQVYSGTGADIVMESFHSSTIRKNISL